MKNLLIGFKKGVKGFGQNISMLVNTILLSVVYFIGVGLTFIFAKIFRKHFLELKLKKDSYWSDLNLSKKKIEEYYRQF